MEDAAFHGATSPYPRYMDGLEMRVAASWGITVRPHFLPAWRFVLLGREDFFAAFRTTLDERAGKLTLEAYQERRADRGRERRARREAGSRRRGCGVSEWGEAVRRDGDRVSLWWRNLGAGPYGGVQRPIVPVALTVPTPGGASRRRRCSTRVRTSLRRRRRCTPSLPRAAHVPDLDR